MESKNKTVTMLHKALQCKKGSLQRKNFWIELWKEIGYTSEEERELLNSHIDLALDSLNKLRIKIVKKYSSYEFSATRIWKQIEINAVLDLGPKVAKDKIFTHSLEILLILLRDEERKNLLTREQMNINSSLKIELLEIAYSSAKTYKQRKLFIHFLHTLKFQCGYPTFMLLERKIKDILSKED